MRTPRDEHLVNEEKMKSFADYWKETQSKAIQFRSSVTDWLKENQAQGELEVPIDDPEDDVDVSDSISQRGNRSSRDGISYISTSASSGSSRVSARLRAKAEKAALEAEALVLQEHNAIELASLRTMMELEEQKMKIEQKRREMELKVKYVRAEAVEKTFAEAEAASRSDLCFTHSTPNTKPTEENTPKHPQDRKPGSSHSALVNDTPQFSAPIRQTSIPAGQSWAPSVIPNSSLSAAKHPDVTDILYQMVNDTRIHQQSLVEALQLPKAELVTFDGNPLEYWSFIRAFENTVGQETIGDGAKLTRLLQYCKGKARQLLQCCAAKGAR